MTTAHVLIAVGAVAVCLFLYGLIRDLRRYGTVQIADRPKPELGQSIDWLAEIRHAGPLPKRIPSGPWSPAEQHRGHTRIGIDEDKAA